MATYDAHVRDFGNVLTFTVAVAGVSVGDLTGAVFTVRVEKPSGSVAEWTIGFAGLTSSRVQFTVPASTYLDEVGPWLFHIRYTLGAVTRTLDPIEVAVGPAGGGGLGSVDAATTSTGLNAQITALAAIATQQSPVEIVFRRGVYALSAVINLASHVWFRCEDGVRFTTTIVGTAPFDDPTVTLFLGQGAISTTKINTTLNGAHYPGDTTIAVVAAGTIAAGDFILIDDNNSPNLEYWEMAEVVSVAANVVTVRTPLRQVWQGGERVRQVTPVRNVRFRGGYLDAAGGTLGCGFLLRSCVDVRIDEVRWAGFTRAAVQADRGTRGFASRDCFGDGQVNCAYFLAQAHEVQIEGYRTTPHVPLYAHASGYARHQVVVRDGCTNVRISGCHFRHVSGGIRMASGIAGLVTDCMFTDLDGQRLYDNGVTQGELDAGNPVGIALCGSYGPLPIADWYDGLVVRGLTLQDVFTPSPTVSLEYHDWRLCQVSHVTHYNSGQSPADRRQYGCRIDDSGGIFSHHSFHGVEVPVKLVKTPGNCQISDFLLNASAGTGLNAQTAIELSTTNLAFWRLVRFVIDNFNVPFAYTEGYVGNAFAELVDWKGAAAVGRATQWETAGGSITRGTLVVPIAGGTFRRVGLAGAQADNCLVVVETAAGFIWCASVLDGQFFVLASGTVVVGDKLESGASGIAVVSTLTDRRCIGTALEARSGAGNSLIQVRA